MKHFSSSWLKEFHSYLSNSKFSQFSWLFSCHVVTLGFSMLSGLLVAKHLGPTQLGKLSYTTSIVSCFAPLLSLGTNEPSLRELTKHRANPSTTQSILGSTIAVRVMGSSFSLVLIILFAMLQHESDTAFLLILAGTSGIFQIPWVLEQVFHANSHSKWSSIARLLGMMISVCLKITAVLLQAETKVFVMLWALDGLWISVFLLASFSKLYHKKILSCPRFENLRDLTQEGLPFMLSGFCIAIMMRSDHIMLHNMLGPKSAGTYAAAIRLTEPWYFISGAILTVMLPKLIDAQKEGIHTYHKAIKRLFRLLFFGSLSICIPLCLLSSFIVKLCYGEAYQASAQILQIHCWTILFVFSSAVSNKWCLLEKKQHLLLARAMIGMSINLVLNWMLIPHLKETGAAIATLASQMTSGYLCLLIFPSSRNLFRLLNKGWLSK